MPSQDNLDVLSLLCPHNELVKLRSRDLYGLGRLGTNSPVMQFRMDPVSGWGRENTASWFSLFLIVLNAFEGSSNFPTFSNFQSSIF